MPFKLHLLLLLYVINFPFAIAQLNGVVLDQVTNQPIISAGVVNLSSSAQSESNEKGEFKIMAKVGDLLVFKSLGYRSDTVLLTSMKPMTHYLSYASNTLSTVNVNGEQDYKKKYAQTFNKANAVLLTPGRGLLFYPSSYFSREGKQARKFKRMVKKEQKELPIDQRFNLKTVTNLLPLKQPELDAFMVLYRPSLAFVLRASAGAFKFYLLDAYNKFKQLPPEKKVLPRLKLEND